MIAILLASGLVIGTYCNGAAACPPAPKPALTRTAERVSRRTLRKETLEMYRRR